MRTQTLTLSTESTLRPVFCNPNQLDSTRSSAREPSHPDLDIIRTINATPGFLDSQSAEQHKEYASAFRYPDFDIIHSINAASRILHCEEIISVQMRREDHPLTHVLALSTESTPGAGAPTAPSARRRAGTKFKASISIARVKSQVGS